MMRKDKGWIGWFDRKNGFHRKFTPVGSVYRVVSGLLDLFEIYPRLLQRIVGMHIAQQVAAFIERRTQRIRVRRRERRSASVCRSARRTRATGAKLPEISSLGKTMGGCPRKCMDRRARGSSDCEGIKERGKESGSFVL